MKVLAICHSARQFEASRYLSTIRRQASLSARRTPAAEMASVTISRLWTAIAPNRLPPTGTIIPLSSLEREREKRYRRSHEQGQHGQIAAAAHLALGKSARERR